MNVNNSTKWDVAEQGVMDRASVSVTLEVVETCVRGQSSEFEVQLSLS